MNKVAVCGFKKHNRGSDKGICRATESVLNGDATIMLGNGKKRSFHNPAKAVICIGLCIGEREILNNKLTHDLVAKRNYISALLCLVGGIGGVTCKDLTCAAVNIIHKSGVAVYVDGKVAFFNIIKVAFFKLVIQHFGCALKVVGKIFLTNLLNFLGILNDAFLLYANLL